MSELATYTEYWVVVAQVVPVLAVAFVIEARGRARQFAKRKFYRERGRRARNAAALFLVAMLLVLAEFISLEKLASASDGKVTNLNPTDYLVTWVAVSVGLASVLIRPVAEVAAVSTSDLAWALARRMPWSWQRRGARRLEGIQRDYDSLVTELTTARLDALLGFARATRILAKAERMKRAATDVANQQALGTTPPSGDPTIANLLAEHASTMEEIAELREEAGLRITDIDSAIDGVRQERQKVTKVLERYRKRLALGATKKQERRLRKRLAEFT